MVFALWDTAQARSYLTLRDLTLRRRCYVSKFTRIFKPSKCLLLRSAHYPGTDMGAPILWRCPEATSVRVGPYATSVSARTGSFCWGQFDGGGAMHSSRLNLSKDIRSIPVQG